MRPAKLRYPISMRRACDAISSGSASVPSRSAGPRRSASASPLSMASDTPDENTGSRKHAASPTHAQREPDEFRFL